MTNKYVTLDEGKDYRGIAKAMSEHGFVMNHATARNIHYSALGKLIRHVSGELGSDLTDEQVKTVLKDQRVHEALADVLHRAVKE